MLTAVVTQVWRNHLSTVEHLLEADTAVDLQDGESGWYALEVLVTDALERMHRELCFSACAAATGYMVCKWL